VAETQPINDAGDAVIVKEEPIDPMIMIMDIEEDPPLEANNPDLSMTVRCNHDIYLPALMNKLPSQDDYPTNGDVAVFKLPRPRPMSERQRTLLMDSCLKRVQIRGHDHSLARGYAEMTFLEQRGKPTPDMWSMILVRMITRGAWSSADVAGENDGEGEDKEDEEDSSVAIKHRDRRQEGEYRMRKMLFDYIILDLTARFVYVLGSLLSLNCVDRTQTAILWLNEEWHNDEIRLKKNPNAVGTRQLHGASCLTDYDLASKLRLLGGKNALSSRGQGRSRLVFSLCFGFTRTTPGIV
jgi:hypothetical protein